MGDTTEARKAGGKALQATYELAMNTHGSIGPSCAVADFKDGELTVWTPSQASHLLRQQLAAMLQLAARARPLHLCRGRGMLWPQRLRRLLVRSGADREGDRPAGAAAMDARRRARLGPERATDPARLSRQLR